MFCLKYVHLFSFIISVKSTIEFNLKPQQHPLPKYWPLLTQWQKLKCREIPVKHEWSCEVMVSWIFDALIFWILIYQLIF